MLTPKQLKKIKQTLEQSQNPLFFFDNDADGLCSFIILQRALDRGKGIAIKSFPELNDTYLRKINELNPDLVVILDKPRVNPDFINQVLEKNLPLMWIDHHNIQVEKEILDKITYFNSFPTAEPTTYIAQKIFNRQEDLWLAMIGCIGDVYMPDFAEQYAEKNPELFNTSLSAFDSLYMTDIGKAIKILNFGLKDSTTHVLQLMKLLRKASSPQDILQETPQTKYLHHHFKQTNKEYQKLLDKAEEQQSKESRSDERFTFDNQRERRVGPNIIKSKSRKKPNIESENKLLFFTYTGPISMSSEISNELYFKNKDKIVVVAYKKQDTVNISMRGKEVKPITEKAIEGLEGASGGGHQNATGARIMIDDLDKFKEKVEELVNSV